MAALGGRHLRPFKTLRRPGQTPGQHAGRSALNGHQIDCRVLASSINLKLEFQLVAFVQFPQARTFNRADVHERIRFAIITRDKAEALHRIEELDRASCLFASALTLRRLALLFDRDHVANHLQICRGNLSAAIDQVESKFLTFGQAFKTSAFDLADVNEDVFAATFLLDEAEALSSIEELHDAFAGADYLRRHSAAATTSAAAWAAEAATTATAAIATAEAIATAATAEAITAAAEPVATATETIITTAKTVAAATKGIEAIFADAVPLVASPAATPSVKTHET